MCLAERQYPIPATRGACGVPQLQLGQRTSRPTQRARGERQETARERAGWARGPLWCGPSLGALPSASSLNGHPGRPGERAAGGGGRPGARGPGRGPTVVWAQQLAGWIYSNQQLAGQWLGDRWLELSSLSSQKCSLSRDREPRCARPVPARLNEHLHVRWIRKKCLLHVVLKDFPPFVGCN